MSEYIVTVKKDANWEELKADLITDTSSNDSVDSSIIPDREVDITEERPNNRRNTEYDLSDDEADALRSDSRVISVTKKADIPVFRPNVIQEGQDASSFNKGTTDSGNQDNWGLLRHISATNNWSGTGTNDPGGAYNYVLDGTGVDVVIMDTGIQADHPEFAISSDPEYDNGAISNVTGDGSDFFKREVTVNGVRIMAAGTVGGQTAVPDAWIDVQTIADLEEISFEFKDKNTGKLRVATKYPNLTNDFLLSKGLTQYKIVNSLGSTEIYPFTNQSEIITDITSSGATLKANNLRVLKDGNILKSSACILVSKKSLKDKNKNKIITSLLKKLN